MTTKPGFAFFVCILLSHVSTGFADDVTSATRDLVTRFCADCHGSPDDSPERGFAIGEYLASKPVDEAGPLWKKAVDAMEGFEMPPPDADQPSAEQRRALVTGIREWLKAAQRPGSPVLRRLTRLEYNNTVRDLLARDTDVRMFSEQLRSDALARKLEYFGAATVDEIVQQSAHDEDALEGKVPLANLWLSMLRSAGIEAGRFADSTDVMKELL